jgi:hypothetical protein
MESLNKQLGVIKHKFPEQSDRIDELFDNDDDFRALCSDYLLCIQNLQQFQREFSEKKRSIKIFQETREELEKELSHFILNG